MKETHASNSSIIGKRRGNLLKVDWAGRWSSCWEEPWETLILIMGPPWEEEEEAQAILLSSSTPTSGLWTDIPAGLMSHPVDASFCAGGEVLFIKVRPNPKAEEISKIKIKENLCICWWSIMSLSRHKNCSRRRRGRRFCKFETELECRYRLENLIFFSYKKSKTVFIFYTKNSYFATIEYSNVLYFSS